MPDLNKIRICLFIYLFIYLFICLFIFNYCSLEWNGFAELDEMANLMQMSSAYFTNVCRIKLSNCQQKNVLVVKKSKVRFTGVVAASATNDKLSMNVIGK